MQENAFGPRKAQYFIYKKLICLIIQTIILMNIRNKQDGLIKYNTVQIGS
jgi:hypothetical protein